MANKVCEYVADRIIAQLDKGIVPWHKPWGSPGNMSVSHSNGKPYSFLNQLLLGDPGEYVTFKQCSSGGGSVRKGEKSKMVVFWNWVEKKEKGEDGTEKVHKYPFLRYYNVYNVSQCDGVEAKYYTMDETEHEDLPDAEKVIEAYAERNPELTFEKDGLSSEAYYSPSEDRIRVPRKGQYKNVNEYYSTIFHEMIHSTGSPKRLNRIRGKEASTYGSKKYGVEELVAEMGAAMLMSRCGIETTGTFDNSAAYIDGWRKLIAESPETVVYAAGRAEKAVEYILKGAKEDEMEDAA